MISFEPESREVQKKLYPNPTLNLTQLRQNFIKISQKFIKILSEVAC